jgi:acyl-CoA synthetase (NDP forming)
MNLSEKDAAQQIARMIEMQAESILNLLKASGKPIVGYTYGAPTDLLQQKLIAAGFPVFSSPERAAAAINALVTYYENRASKKY